MKKRIGKMIGLAALGILVLGAVFVAGSYLHDMAAARARLSAGSKTVKTVRGIVEYGEAGSGEPVLVIHGAGGGFDQGLYLGKYGLGAGFRVIAPSRFGYAGQRIPPDSSLEAQADAYASLLDALGIDGAVPVVAFSAGGLSGLTFAARHPERVRALVMVSAKSIIEKGTHEQERKAKTLDSAINGSFVYWTVDRLMRPRLLEMLGLPRKVQEGLTPEAQEAVNRVMEEMHPMAVRLPGIRLDERRSFPQDFPSLVKRPTLVIHCKDDLLVSLKEALHTHEQIAGSRLITYPTGGHFLAGRLAEVRGAITSFLAEVR